jgi:restriction endonuclease Mrr
VNNSVDNKATNDKWAARRSRHLLALHGRKARKGVFMTELLIDHSVGVSTVASYEIKKIDADYFVEE